MQVPASTAADALIVRGTAHHRRGRAIRNVYIGARAATATSFNFATWTATLDAEDLRAVVEGSAASQRLRVDVTAVDFAGARCVLAVESPIELEM